MIDIDGLRETVRERPSGLFLTHIARDADIGIDWLKKFATGYAPEKETRNIKRLARYFAERDA